MVAGRRSGGPGPRRRPAGWSRRRSLAPSPGRRREHGAAIPVVPIVETRQADRRGAGRWRQSIGPSWPTAQTPQGVRADAPGARLRDVPAGGPETWTDEAALLEACRIPVHAIPGEPTNLKVTTPDDLTRAELVLLGPAPVRIGYRRRPSSVRARRAARPRRDRDRRRAAPARPLGRRRGSPRGRRRAARRRRPGRPRPAVPGRTRHPEGHRQQPSSFRRSSAGSRAAGLRPARVDLTIVAARPRLGDRARRHAGRDRRAARRAGRPGQRQGVQREPGRGRGRRSRGSPPGRSPPSNRSDDGPPARHAVGGAA